MSAEDGSNGAAAAQQRELEHQQQQHLGDDAGIPQLPGAPGSEGAGPQGGVTGQEGGPQEPTNYGAGASYQQQQQQQQQHGEANPQGSLTEEERTARKIFVGGLNRNTTGINCCSCCSIFLVCVRMSQTSMC